MRRAALVASLLMAGIALVACTSLTGQVAPYRPHAYYAPPNTVAGAGPINPGQQLYQRDCAFCHGADGKGTSQAPDLTVETNGAALTDFVLRTGRMPVTRVVTQMRSRKPFYNESEMSALVAYVRTTFRGPGPDIPDVDPRRGNLARGQQLYEENCAACHATTGIGGAMLMKARGGITGGSQGIVIPSVTGTDALAVAEAVRTGPGSMPVFGPRVIADDQLDSLVRYVLYLQQPDNRGGAPIGGVGPVMEGAVGWLVGLGGLVVIIRWMGTKAGELE